MNQEELRDLEEKLRRRIHAVDKAYFDKTPEALHAIAEASKALILLLPYLKD